MSTEAVPLEEDLLRVLHAGVKKKKKKAPLHEEPPLPCDTRDSREGVRATKWHKNTGGTLLPKLATRKKNMRDEIVCLKWVNMEMKRREDPARRHAEGKFLGKVGEKAFACKVLGGRGKLDSRLSFVK